MQKTTVTKTVQKPKAAAKKQKQPKQIQQTITTQTTQKATAPVAKATSKTYGMKLVSASDDRVKYCGREYLFTYAMPATDVPAGTALMQIDLNPLYLDGTRLSVEAALWEKFRFNKLKLHFVSNQPSTVPGMVALSFDPDVTDPNPPVSDAGLHQFLSFRDHKADKVWADFTLDVKGIRATFDPLFTNETTAGDPRLAYQGQIYLFAVTKLPVASIGSGNVLGLIEMEYECEFFTQAQDDVSVGLYKAYTNNSASSVPMLNGNTINTPAIGNLLGFGTSSSTVQAVAGPPLITQQSSMSGSTNQQLQLFLREGMYLLSQVFQNMTTNTNTDTFTVANPILTPKSATPPVGSGYGITRVMDNRVVPNQLSVGTTEYAVQAQDLIRVPPGGAWLDSLNGLTATTNPTTTAAQAFKSMAMTLVPLKYKVYNGFNTVGTFFNASRIKDKESKLEIASTSLSATASRFRCDTCDGRGCRLCLK